VATLVAAVIFEAWALVRRRAGRVWAAFALAAAALFARRHTHSVLLLARVWRLVAGARAR
jgi:hypothetical protein